MAVVFAVRDDDGRAPPNRFRPDDLALPWSEHDGDLLDACHGCVVEAAASRAENVRVVRGSLVLKFGEGGFGFIGCVCAILGENLLSCKILFW